MTPLPSFPAMHFRSLAFALLCAAVSVSAVARAESPGDEGEAVDARTVVADIAASGQATLLGELDAYLRERGIELDGMTVDGMVGVMVDWYRATPDGAGGQGGSDLLLFRYGGWSEGCATGFNVSLLRRAGERGTAGITLMFEPSGGAELDAYSTALAGPQSIEAFVQSVRGSPAFRRYGSARPMAAMLEKGGLR